MAVSMPEPCHSQDSGDVQMHNVRHSPHTPSNKTESFRHVPVVHLLLLQTHCHLPEFAAWLSLPSATSVTLSYLIPWHFKTVYWLGASEILQRAAVMQFRHCSGLVRQDRKDKQVLVAQPCATS